MGIGWVVGRVDGVISCVRRILSCVCCWSCGVESIFIMVERGG